MSNAKEKQSASPSNADILFYLSFYAIIYLTSAQVAETADELGLVQTIGGHLHASNDDHGPVHSNKLLLGDVDIERGKIAVVGFEGILMEVDVDAAGGRRGKSADGLSQYQKKPIRGNINNRVLNIWWVVRKMNSFRL
jgi:hypothetical protein